MIADFRNLPAAPSFRGCLAPLAGWSLIRSWNSEYDEVYLAYTNFYNMVKQVPEIKKLLPLEMEQHAHISMTWT